MKHEVEKAHLVVEAKGGQAGGRARPFGPPFAVLAALRLRSSESARWDDPPRFNVLIRFQTGEEAFAFCGLRSGGEVAPFGGLGEALVL